MGKAAEEEAAEAAKKASPEEVAKAARIAVEEEAAKTKVEEVRKQTVARALASKVAFIQAVVPEDPRVGFSGKVPQESSSEASSGDEKPAKKDKSEKKEK